MKINNAYYLLLTVLFTSSIFAADAPVRKYEAPDGRWIMYEQGNIGCTLILEGPDAGHYLCLETTKGKLGDFEVSNQQELPNAADTFTTLRYKYQHQQQKKQ